MTLRLISAAAFLIFLVVLGCSVSSKSESDRQSSKSGLQAAQSNKSDDLISSGIFDANPTALKAWLKFIADSRYRAANGHDFKFSEPAKTELRSMFEDEWYSRVEHPAITGNISRRHGFKDLAVIVVDNKRNDAARFGVVIFNVEPDRDELSVHWLFQNRDLSSALLSWHSNWPVLVFYDEKGSSDPYYINWNENTKEYFLDKQQVGPDARPGTLRVKQPN